MRGEKLEGIYLSALVPEIRKLVLNSRCSQAGMSSSRTLSLHFSGGWLNLHAAPESPGIWWSEKESVTAPSSPSWEHHLDNAVVDQVVQQSSDRVIELRFRERTPYDRGGVRLIFEITGRNTNIILARNEDSRILACLRKVLSRINRYRSISPGSVYNPPPVSGIPVRNWQSPETAALLEGITEPGEICRLLEGVGPAAAQAILLYSKGPAEAVKYLGQRISSQDFQPWETPKGKLPVPIGNGKPVNEPLAPPADSEGKENLKEYRPAADDLEKLLKKKAGALRKKIRSAQLSLERLESPERLRMLGSLLLTWKHNLKKGMSQARLKDWSGKETVIPLKQSLNPAENAGRYFRRAGSIHIEQERLEKMVSDYTEELAEIQTVLHELGTLPEHKASEMLEKFSKNRDNHATEFLEFLLPGGWRCLAGRNAVQNDRLTFRKAARDDIWLHARGVAGAHVIIRRDGRPDNPSAEALEEAAGIAAAHASTSGIVPVDWTLVKFVRRQKGGGPGQVVYTREKTVFAQV